MTKNLWPPKFEEENCYPLILLKDQCKYLAEAMENKVIAKVEVRIKNNKFCAYFDLIKKHNENDFVYNLFEVHFTIDDFFPALIVFYNQTSNVNNQEEYEEYLKLIFNDKKTQKILSCMKDMP